MARIIDEADSILARASHLLDMPFESGVDRLVAGILDTRYLKTKLLKSSSDQRDIIVRILEPALPFRRSPDFQSEAQGVLPLARLAAAKTTRIACS